MRACCGIKFRVAVLRISKLFYREFRNFERVFNTGPRDLEYLPGNNMRERVVAILEAERAQSFVVRGSEALNFIRAQGGVLDELVNSHNSMSTRGGCDCDYRNLACSRKTSGTFHRVLEFEPR